MGRQKARWIPVITALIAIISVFWYTRPVDIYGLGMDELKTINVQEDAAQALAERLQKGDRRRNLL